MNDSTATSTAALPATSSTSLSIQQIIDIPDLWLHRVVPFFTVQDIGRWEQVRRQNPENNNNNNSNTTWQILCRRDFQTNDSDLQAPDSSSSFHTLSNYETWKQVYQHWHHWHSTTHRVTTTAQARQAIQIYQTIQSYCTQNNLMRIRNSLAHALDKAALQEWVKHPWVPSDLIAWHAVCGGQVALTTRSENEDYWAALLGCYTCYDTTYAMRLVDANRIGPVTQPHMQPGDCIVVALSIGNPRWCLSVKKDPIHDPHGRLVRLHPLGDDTAHIVVGDEGILSYFQSYVNHLTRGIYVPAVQEAPDIRGISLFPAAGNDVSVCVTHGIEVKASARWLPSVGDTNNSPNEGLNFGYSIRIQMVQRQHDAMARNTCQLLSRHWEFVNGHGTVRRVDGEGVVGKQPLFFCHYQDDSNNTVFGYHDLGPAGDDQIYTNEVFAYQSQTGPVAGTTRDDTRGAHIRGTFRFVPGSLEHPTGPMFSVTVAPFPLTISFPFY